MASSDKNLFKNTPPKGTVPTPTGTENAPVVVKPEYPFEKPADVITWTSHERVFSHRKPVWFVALFALTGGVVLALVLLQQWTFALALITFAIVMFIMNVVEPGNREYRITTTGVKMGNKRFSYGDLKWFWFSELEEHDVLYIATYLKFPHILELPLADNNSEQFMDQIENQLLKYIPYHEEGQRNWMNIFDKLIYYISPWLPNKVVEWYANKTR
ncbi:hypothetical protein GW793_04680 [bacterium]|nr:hypothetical protein [bacterium]